MTIKMGCCGWSVRGGHQAYYEALDLIEIQSTFYKLPRIQTVERWRQEAREGFEFTVKAWQAITHPPESPTWRKAGLKIPMERADRYGYLRPTEENFEAWRATKEVCDALHAGVCVVQCPPSFLPSPENIGNMKAFLSEIERGDMSIAWKPRGEWRQQGDKVREVCESLDLVHATDVFRWKPCSRHQTSYLRLHGIGREETNYSYTYTDDDLAQLLHEVRQLEAVGKQVYVLFNNISMFQDLMRFNGLLSRCSQ